MATAFANDLLCRSLIYGRSDTIRPKRPPSGHVSMSAIPSVPSRSSTEGAESRALVQQAFLLARTLGIETLVVQADGARDIQQVDKVREKERVIWLLQEMEEMEERPEQIQETDPVVAIPETRLARITQVMFGLFIAVLRGDLELDETIVCLSGVAGSRRLDTLLIAKPERYFPWLAEREMSTVRSALATRVFAQVLQLALRFAAEGREGKPIGTIFVIGAEEQLEEHTRQLILNPLAGHPKKLRSVFSSDFVESMRELAALDGAFVVSDKGTVEAAGVYLDGGGTRVRLPRGLGARHAAAAGITAVSDAIAIALSESSGTVTVFHGGEMVLKLEAPAMRSVRAVRRRRRRPKPADGK